jgi:hypothetical protein
MDDFVKTEDRREEGLVIGLLVIWKRKMSFKFEVFSTRTRAMLDCGRLSNLGSSESGEFSVQLGKGDW